MKKATVALFTGILLSCAFLNGQTPTTQAPYSATQNAIKWESNYDQAISQAKATSKPILILFTGTNWCPACMKLEKGVLNHPEFAKAVGQKFIFLKADFPNYTAEEMNKSPYKTLFDRFGIKEFPTIVVINADGQKLFTVPYQTGGVNVYIQQLAKAQ